MKKIAMFFLMLLISGCSKVEMYEKNVFAMDTYMSIKVYSKKNANNVVEEAGELFKYYDTLFDRYNKADINNIYTLNNMNGEVVVDEDLASLITFANDMYTKSNGLLDISMGLVIDEWKNAAISGVVPDINTLNSLYAKRSEMLVNGNVVTTNASFIDVGAIAKGYAIGKVSEFLEEEGYTEYLINAGGQVQVGSKYRKDKYKIGVQNPEAKGTILVLNAENVGVSTSGGYERNFEVNGVVYNHIINPKTLFPANFMKSVSVVSKDPLLADALTTILFLMPIEEGLEFIKDYDAEAVFYSNDSEIIKTEGLSKYE